VAQDFLAIHDLLSDEQLDDVVEALQDDNTLSDFKKTLH
jgi:hypothetical protein